MACVYSGEIGATGGEAMTTEARSILWFDEVGKHDVDAVGGKGANLGELVRAQIPVPPGFVVSTGTYRRFLEETGLTARIRALREGLDVQDSARLQRVAAEIRDLILAAPMPLAVAEEICACYARLGGGRVAVRSSATAEDLAEASFAGQQATYLNVEGGEQVVEAVQRCWASLFEARAIFYRAQVGFDDLDVDLAVPVQRMVQSEASGVMFTIEPVHNDRSRLVIEAVFGLGEAAVSGRVTPDHYEVRKRDLSLLAAQHARQTEQLIENPEAQRGEAGSMWVPMAGEAAARAKLDDTQIRELATVGLQVEEHYGRPQDIEWGLAGGHFYILQTRAVTTTGNGSGQTIPAPAAATAPILRGAPAGPGVGRGRVRIVTDAAGVARVGDGDVLVAEMTTPDFVPAMKRAAAIVTDRGGRTCHAAIISRELGVPCVVGTDTATRALVEDMKITVDGSGGRVYAGEERPLLAWWEDVRRARASATPKRQTDARIYVNLADPDLAEAVAARDVDGVGLLRAEFMMARFGADPRPEASAAERRGEHPRSFVQSGRSGEFIDLLEDGMERIAGAFDPRPVVYRATDFKSNEYRGLRGGEEFEPKEENPMIGYRGAARYLREPDLFALEMEALKRVRRRHPNLHLMIPFVRTVPELAAVLRLVEENGLQRREDFQVWMMVEVPSNIILLDEFIAQGIDGISIGSNDLTQLTLGIDRESERFADAFDERDPAVLASLEKAIVTAKRHGITVSICGQAPSEHPDLTERLVGWGITSVSVTPDMIDQTRGIVAEAEARHKG